MSPSLSFSIQLLFFHSPVHLVGFTSYQLNISGHLGQNIVTHKLFADKRQFEDYIHDKIGPVHSVLRNFAELHFPRLIAEVEADTDVDSDTNEDMAQGDQQADKRKQKEGTDVGSGNGGGGGSKE